MRTVNVPKKFAPLFERAQHYVAEYFANRVHEPERARIELSGQRYMLVRAGAMSVEFFEMVRGLYRGDDREEATSVARSLLFDIAHAMGIADAKVFAKRMGVSDPIGRLSAGPIHFAHAGWAFVSISAESQPTPDEDYFLLYDHPYSFESDSWLSAGKRADFPVCIMNAGYSSGWCESSFGLPLVASEVICRAKGDEACRFIMAPPASIETRIQKYLAANPDVQRQVTSYEVPGFFARKRAEDALRASHEQLKQANAELEQRMLARTQELKRINAELLRDIRERQRAEEALSASEELNRRIIEALPGGLVHVEADGAIVHANGEACRILGLSFHELTGKFIAEFETISIHEDGRPAALADFPVARALSSGQHQEPKVFGVRHPHGEVAWAVYTAVPLTDAKTGRTSGAIVTFLDITERKREEEARRQLEIKLLQAKKLESLGVLAGGIAHDFNNLLVGVLGNASLAREVCPSGSEIDQLLESLEQAANRAQALTKQMLAYSGRGHFRIERVQLSQEVKNLSELVTATLPTGVRVDYRLTSGPSAVDADVTQLHQVVSSLLANAVESIVGVGTVCVRTGERQLAREELARSTLGDAAAPGKYVFLEVADTGMGMNEETRHRIFEPFFTTKFSGRGLGLAAVLGIVRGHRGVIQVESAPGQGTRIRVLLPSASAFPSELPAPSRTGSTQRLLVLVVDEEEMVVSVVTKTLQGAGFATLCARSGREGVALAQQHLGRLAAVVLDWTLPDISGSEVFTQLRRLDRRVPVIVTSGHSLEEVSPHIPREGLAGFLEKPFTPHELRKMVTLAIESN